MAKYSLSNKAVDDLSAIWNYTFETWSEHQADKYYEMLVNFCQRLADDPTLGKQYAEITEDLLGFRTGKHVIFYRIVSAKEIEVIRILHERMDLKNRVQE